MIVVLADDITGAAELGGIALKHGLRVEIVDDSAVDSDADVLIVCTNTRSLNKKEAANAIEKQVAGLQRVQPALIYKKVDSVLRGHILMELKVQMQALKVQRALLVPSNPHLGRTIKNGFYFFNNEPVHQSGFSQDPEFPVNSSNVLDMLQSCDTPVSIRKPQENLPEAGIIVGEASTKEDLDSWASYVSETIVLAGASDFFAAVLNKLYGEAKNDKGIEKISLSGPVLLVSGTTFTKSVQQIKEFVAAGLVSYMPSSIVSTLRPATESYERWACEVVAIVSKHGKAIMAIDESSVSDKPVAAVDLREKTSIAVEKVFEKIWIRELLLEGGSTAFSILKKIGFHKLVPKEELDTGVIRMQVPDKKHLHVTVKPGSYDWPAVLNF